MSGERIRPIALGAVRRGEDLLVQELEDPTAGETFYRLLGGGVEFGEHSREALVREFDEELDVDLEISRDLCTLERVFEFDGEPGHEIWRVYEGTIAEAWPYEEETFTFVEPDLDEELLARWLSLETLRDPETTFYVPEILETLAERPPPER